MMKIGSVMIHTDITVSTNNYAAILLQEDRVVEGTVISTGFQTGGRGQAGNNWESENNKNLLFSIILYPERIPPGDQFLISKAVSLGISGFLMRYISDISIKWPNDIYAGNDKIAGILIENAIAGSRMVHSIAGTGLNVNQTIFTSNAPNPVSMKLITGMEYDTSLLLRELLDSIDSFYQRILKYEKDSLENEYHNLLFRKGEWHLYRAGGGWFRGMIIGTDSSGCLLVQDESGRETAYMFKEIEYL
ncbi:MAG: biotin--[acetyl-CoA-carboxylase] ligase [Bacteroidales bacterium]